MSKKVSKKPSQGAGSAKPVKMGDVLRKPGSLTIPRTENYYSEITLKSKDKYNKQPQCTICYQPFTTTIRQHHCRVCADAVCGDCSKWEVNGERACDKCIMRYSCRGDKDIKAKVISTLETLCAVLVNQRKLHMQELEEKGKATEVAREELKREEAKVREMEAWNQKVREEEREASEQLQAAKAENRKLEEEIEKLGELLTGVEEEGYE
jgi:hypothetical protein